MKLSEYYQREMYFWTYSRNQTEIMMNEKCVYNDFKLIKN